ncbi:MAG: MlaD family protein [Myxococcaceae bacterium]
MSDTPTPETPTHREKRLVVRAGIFVAIALLLAALVVLFIGRERRYFDRQVMYRAAFENVEGLKKDSPVWLGGLEVGRVSNIRFAEDLGDQRIEVQIELSRQYSDRVRQDSIARLASRGVLGDRAIDVSLGTPESPPIPVGGFIAIGSSGDLSSLMKAAGRVVDDATAITGTLRTAVAAYGDPKLARDVAGAVASLRQVLDGVATGEGALNALVFDPRTGSEVRTLVSNAQKAARSVDSAVTHLDGILEEVHQGRGGAHALIYEREGAQAVADIGQAAAELATILKGARQSKDGAVYQLVYGDAREMFADLGAAAADLRKVTHTIASGKGSIGALINDPTLYDDLKQVLGNVKRNRVLRALVRMSITNQEDLGQIGQTAGKPPKAPPTDD